MLQSCPVVFALIRSLCSSSCLLTSIQAGDTTLSLYTSIPLARRGKLSICAQQSYIESLAGLGATPICIASLTAVRPTAPTHQRAAICSSATVPIGAQSVGALHKPRDLADHFGAQSRRGLFVPGHKAVESGWVTIGWANVFPAGRRRIGNR